MIKINWIKTNEYYRRILAEPDVQARRQLYIDLMVEPWLPMMQMMRRPGDDTPPDALDGPRAWAWLLPDQTEAIATILEQMEAADAWKVGEEALRKAASRFDGWNDRIPFDEVAAWLVLADPTRSNPLERGYTGATDWLSPRVIGQFWEPNEHNLPRIGGLFAHEMHHLIRLRTFPWDMQRTTVADYIVLEGTAEAFAASLFGEQSVGYFITEFDPAEFERARDMIGAGLDAVGFDVIRSYIFGDALAERAGYQPLGGMPTYGGYAIGYQVVQAFMRRTGLPIEEVTFLPSTEIVAGSGFFA